MHVRPTALLVGDENQAEAGEFRSSLFSSPVSPPVSPSRLIYHRGIARAHTHWRMSKWLCIACTRDRVTYAIYAALANYS